LAEGRAKGEAKGRADGETRVLDLMAKGYSIERIKEILKG
jgi:hypothetical protein